MSSIPYSHTTLLAQTAAISISLATSGGILAISNLINPLLDNSARSVSSSQPDPSSTLPAVRFIFSRGSHIFPQAASIAGAAYFYLWYNTPTSVALGGSGSIAVLRDVLGLDVSRRVGYLVAGLMTVSIGPITGLMLPAANQRLRELADMEAKGNGEKVDREELKVLVSRFGYLNYARGVAMLVGGIVGVVTALS